MAVYDPRGGGNVHIDVVLSQISVGYPNPGMVGEALFPRVNVNRISDKYYIFGRETWAVHPGGDLRAPGTVANEIEGLLVSTDTYFAQEHSLQLPITDEERENADSPLAPDRDGTELVTAKILLAREIAIKDMATTTTNYATGYSTTIAGTDQWNDYVTVGGSDPIGDIRTGFRKIHSGLFLEPNVAIIPYQVMTQLEDHPAFIERIKYSERGILTAEIIGSVLGIETIIVPGMGYNSANPGQTQSLGYLWGKDVVLAYVPPRAGMKIPAYGYEFNWGYRGSRPMVVERWREEPRKSDLVRCSRRYDLKHIAVDGTGKSIAGYLIKSAVA
jgi:hypothetical protein